MNKYIVRQSLILLLAAFIWGIAFVAQSVGMDYVEPFTFSMARNFLGSLVLLPVIAYRSWAAGKHTSRGSKESMDAVAGTENGTSAKIRAAEERKLLWKGGICCGVLLAVAANLQQFGIKYSTVGKSGFVTALYIVLVPMIGIALGKKASGRIWAGVALAVVGLYFLCMQGGSFSLERGDWFLLLCAVAFSFQILAVDYFAPKVDGVKLACLEFFVCGLCSAVGMALTEHPSLAMLAAAWLPIAYAGVLSSGVAYTLQIIGQKGMNPAVASLIMSLESVISVLAGWVLLHQKLSGRELLGCVLMFSAIILVQLPGRKAGESVVE